MESQQDSMDAEEVESGTLNWSVSAISAAGGPMSTELGGLRNYQPSQGSLSSPDENTDHDLQSQSQMEEMYKLLENLQSLIPPPEAPSTSSLATSAAEATIVHRTPDGKRVLVSSDVGRRFASMPVEDDESSQDETGDLMEHITPKNQLSTPKAPPNLPVQPTALNTTPPCRDTDQVGREEPLSAKGKDGNLLSSNSKLNEMRGLLSALEADNKMSSRNSALSTRTSSASKIPRRRTLNFTGSSTLLQASLAKADHEAVGKGLEQKNAALEQQLAASKVEISRLRDHLSASRRSEAEKEGALQEFRTRMAETAKRWEVHRGRSAVETKEKEEELEKTRGEVLGLKKQVSCCEAELERAVRLAAEFRLRAEDGEKARDVAEAARSNWEATAGEKERQLEQAQSELSTLNSRLAELETRKAAAEAALQSADQARNRNELAVNRERANFKSMSEELSKKQRELEASLLRERDRTKELETYWHQYYQTEMEKILEQKVRYLREQIGDLEKNLESERVEQLRKMEEQHAKELEQLKESFLGEYRRVLVQITEQKNILERALKAAREESDCLREQLVQSEKLASSSQQLSRLWSSGAGPSSAHALLDHRAAFPSGISLSSMSSANNPPIEASKLRVNREPEQHRPPPVLNNHRPGACALERPTATMADDGDSGKVVNNTNDNPLGMWSDMLLQGPIGNVNELSGSSTTTNSASAALSREEKEAILQQFEKQNLESKLLGDASFMSRYRAMADQMLSGSTDSDLRIGRLAGHASANLLTLDNNLSSTIAGSVKGEKGCQGNSK